MLARSGLRSEEVLQVRLKDVVDTEAGPRVYVFDGKREKDRQTMAPLELVSFAETVIEYGGREIDKPFIETKYPETLRRWVKRTVQKMHEKTGDPGWQYLSPHDLRGTWATELVKAHSVDPMWVMDWGGWEDIDTFREHYEGAYTPDVQRRELSGPLVGCESTESGFNPHLIDHTEPRVRCIHWNHRGKRCGGVEKLNP